MATGSTSGQYDLGALEFEAKPDLFQTRFGHRLPQTAAIGSVEHQEAAAPRAYQLPANGSIAHCQCVPLIDIRVADALRAAFLVLPVLVQQLAESRQIAEFQ